MLEDSRVPARRRPLSIRVVVAIDPAASSNGSELGTRTWHMLPGKRCRRGTGEVGCRRRRLGRYQPNGMGPRRLFSFSARTGPDRIVAGGEQWWRYRGARRSCDVIEPKKRPSRCRGMLPAERLKTRAETDGWGGGRSTSKPRSTILRAVFPETRGSRWRLHRRTAHGQTARPVRPANSSYRWEHWFGA